MNKGVSDHFIYMHMFKFSNLWNLHTILYLKIIDNFGIFKFWKIAVLKFSKFLVLSIL
jgi:hypothetical protein